MQFTDVTSQLVTAANLKQCGDTDIFSPFVDVFYSEVFGSTHSMSYDGICSVYSQQSTRTICNEYLNAVDTVTGHMGILKQLNEPASCIAPLNYSIKNISVVPATNNSNTVLLHVFMTGTAVQLVNSHSSFTSDADFPFSHTLILALEIIDNIQQHTTKIMTELLHVHMISVCKCNRTPSHVYPLEDDNCGTTPCNPFFEPSCLFTPTASSTLTPLSAEKAYQLDIWSSLGSPAVDNHGSDIKSRFDDIFRLHGSWNSPDISPFAPMFDNNDVKYNSEATKYSGVVPEDGNVDAVFDASVLKCIEAIQSDYAIGASIDSCSRTACDIYGQHNVRTDSPTTGETTTPLGSFQRSSPTSSFSKTTEEQIRLSHDFNGSVRLTDTCIEDDVRPPSTFLSPKPQIYSQAETRNGDYMINKFCEKKQQGQTNNNKLSPMPVPQKVVSNDQTIGQSKRKKQNQLTRTKDRFEKHPTFVCDENTNTCNQTTQQQLPKNVSAKHGPPLWGLLDGERDRMVYVSWVPRVARADEISKKKKCVMQLRWFIFSYLGFTGLEKVLLYPPSSAHCKLLFDTEDTAKRFLTQFGGTMEQSAGPQRWKEAICKYYKVDILDGIKGTKVKIIWADAAKEAIPKQ